MDQNGSFQVGTREAVEALLGGLEESGGASLTAHVKSLHKCRRGAYFVHVGVDREWNEITVKLFEDTTARVIATGFIDRGHDVESRSIAAEELRGLVRAYLCR